MLEIERLDIGFVVRNIGVSRKCRVPARDKYAVAGKVLAWLGFSHVTIEVALFVLRSRASKLPDPREATGIWTGQRSIGVLDETFQEVVQRDHRNRLDVLGAAQAYVEVGDDCNYSKLVKAVKKWRKWREKIFDAST